MFFRRFFRQDVIRFREVYPRNADLSSPAVIFSAGRIGKESEGGRKKQMEPALGFEPRTYALQVRSSTPELSWQPFPVLHKISRNRKNARPLSEKTAKKNRDGKKLKKLQKKIVPGLLFSKCQGIIRKQGVRDFPDVDIVAAKPEIRRNPEDGGTKRHFTAVQDGFEFILHTGKQHLVNAGKREEFRFSDYPQQYGKSVDREMNRKSAA